MTDKPDWEKAWRDIYPTEARWASEGENGAGEDREVFRAGYLAASARREADIARAKAEVLAELKARARALDAEGWVSPAHFWCAYEEAREKYSEPTAVAATEKEG